MKITLTNGSHHFNGGPVRLPWPEREAAALALGDTVFPGQISEEPAGRFLVFIAPAMEPNARLALETRIQKNSPAHMALTDGAHGLDIAADGELVATYRYNGVARPYINPLNGPRGKSVLRPPASEGNPEKIDHIHHRGLQVAHGDTNGVDNWSEEPGHGWTVHQEFLARDAGPVFARFATRNFWVNAARTRKLLEEVRTVTCYRGPDERRILDQAVVLKATEGEVVFKDTKESGLMTVRVCPTMQADQHGAFRNSVGGINEGECWGKRAHWCDYYGPVDDVTVGIALFDHPANLRHPTWWHIRNYGLMTANFFGLSDFTGDKRITGTYVLPAFQEMALLHRVYVHAGTTDQARIADAYLNFLYPPTVEG